MRFAANLSKGVMTAVLLVFMFAAACENKGGSSQAAPEFSLEDINGRTASLSDHRGQVVLLDFWATWCPPCRMSIPELVHLQEKYKEKGVVVLGVSLDDPVQFTNEYIRAFKNKFNINYRVLRSNMQVVKDYFGYESPVIPTLFVIDREGKIRDKLVGFEPKATERALARLLEQ